MDIIIYTLVAIIGLCVGSFLNVVIYRVPLEMSIAFPGSHCPKCDYELRWYDNIPVLSYLILKGKCRKCHEPISIRYTLVEIANMVLWIVCAILFWKESTESIIYACSAMIASSVLICIFFIDLEHMLIFNRFTITIAVLGLINMFVVDFANVWDYAIGGISGALLFAGLYFGAIFVLKKEGFGWGDVKLVAAAGLLLGWQKLILAMLIASILGSIVLIGIKYIKKDEDGKEYPFAPFIVVGILTALLFGSPIITWYMQLIL
jgi:leader peptidase (prepilin peptidase)/N-methyltransferase